MCVFVCVVCVVWSDVCVWWYEERAGVVRDLALCDLTLMVEGKLGVASNISMRIMAMIDLHQFGVEGCT